MTLKVKRTVLITRASNKTLELPCCIAVNCGFNLSQFNCRVLSYDHLEIFGTEVGPLLS